jgi:hypothetical protein
MRSLDLLERCDLGVKTAALAALGEMAALREEGVAEPLVLVCRGVKEGESTLKRFFTFSFWFSLAWSWMYGQASYSRVRGGPYTSRSCSKQLIDTYCSRSGSGRRW